MSEVWTTPKTAPPKGKKAAKIIRDFCRAKGLDNTGGCKVFYSPKEWRERGEQYGTKSLLIVVYDGGDHTYALNMDYAAETRYVHIEDLGKALQDEGMYLEECTCWYSAVYPT